MLLKVWNADHGPQCEAQEPAAGRNWGEMGEMQGMPPCATGQATPRAYANMPAVGARAPGPGVEASAEAAEAAASAGPSSSSADAASKQVGCLSPDRSLMVPVHPAPPDGVDARPCLARLADCLSS